MALRPERRWPSSRARRWKAGPSRSMRPSRVNRAVRPAGPAGSPPRGMPLRATLSQDGHPLGVAVGVFVQNSPPAVSVGWPEPGGLLPAFLGAGHLCCGRVRRIDDDVLVCVDIGQRHACGTPPLAWQLDGCPLLVERRGRMTPETAYDMDITPEYALLL